MKVDLVRLRLASDKLWQHLEEMSIDTLDIPYDYYWFVSAEQAYRLEVEPAQHAVGRLSDDWQDLLNVLEPDNDAITHDFVRLSALLRVVGELIVP